MREINFAKNWNKKLDGEIFTTIRKNGFGINVNEVAHILLNHKRYAYATCISKTITHFHKIPFGMLVLDTGLHGAEMLKTFRQFGMDYEDPNCVVELYYFKKSIAVPMPTDKQLGIFDEFKQAKREF